eukprot:9615270-Heterocapsa_arctica.AAC.1
MGSALPRGRTNLPWPSQCRPLRLLGCLPGSPLREQGSRPGGGRELLVGQAASRGSPAGRRCRPAR